MNRVPRVFVYGSLLRGLGNHPQLAGARFLGEAETTGGFALYDLGPFPAMVAEGNGFVRGELFDVDEGMLRRLDAFEGCPHLYVRTAIRPAAGGLADAYLQRSTQVRGALRIESGDWRQHYATRDSARRTKL